MLWWIISYGLWWNIDSRKEWGPLEHIFVPNEKYERVNHVSACMTEVVGLICYQGDRIASSALVMGLFICFQRDGIGELKKKGIISAVNG